MKPFLRKLTGAHLTGWKQWLVHALVLMVIAAVGGFLVAASGIIPIKASSGHWAITEWFLQFSKTRSVDTYTKTIEAPPLEDPTLVSKGAGHYHIGCFPCHGNPEIQHPRVAQAMLPPAPYLGERIAVWEPEELFYIVKHGIKFTGMPAWPAQQRDDEVWAVVAFLQKFPDLDIEEYRRLTTGGIGGKESAPLQELTPQNAPPLRVSETCGSCHGVNGRGGGHGAFPKLAGQSEDYLAATLEAYRARERHSGIMQVVAGGLTQDEIHKIASYYSERDPSSSNRSESDTNQEAIDRGEKIASEGIPESRVPACIDCHGPSDHPRNSHYPALAGQSADYLALQLELFQKQHRGGTAYAHLMDPVAKHLTAEQIRDVAVYYESLGE